MLARVWERFLQEGASLSGTLTSSSTQVEQTAAIRHIGNGEYELSASLEQAGSYQLLVQLERNSNHDSPAAASAVQAPSLEAEVACIAGPVAAGSCKVELQTEAWVAGQPAVVLLHKFDR